MQKDGCCVMSRFPWHFVQRLYICIRSQYEESVLLLFVPLIAAGDSYLPKPPVLSFRYPLSDIHEHCCECQRIKSPRASTSTFRPNKTLIYKRIPSHFYRFDKSTSRKNAHKLPKDPFPSPHRPSRLCNHCPRPHSLCHQCLV